MQAIDFSELKERVESHNSDLVDDVVALKNISYQGEGRIDFKANEAEAELFGENVIALKEGQTNDWSYKQLCNRLGLPNAWLTSDKCPPELEKMNFDWKFENLNDGESGLLLRQRTSGEIRAVLSESYTPYDHITFIEALADALEYQEIKDQVEIVKWTVGDQMRAYCLIKGIEITPPPDAPTQNGRHRGDDNGGQARGLRPGFYISNNEIGGGRTRIHPAVYDGYCTNGMIYGWQASEEQFAFVHRGRSEQTMMALMNEAIVASLNMSEMATQKFLNSRYAVIERGRAASIVDLWATKYALRKPESEAWQNEVIAWENRNGNVTWFDLMNSLTFNAQQFEDLTTQESMERMAGDMLAAGAPMNYLANREEYAALVPATHTSTER